eukprot:2739154-Rhodomonas_salina.2
MLVDATGSERDARTRLAPGSCEIRESVGSAFQWVAGQGVLCEEPLHAVAFSLIDVVLHRLFPDPTQRENTKRKVPRLVAV